MSKVKSFFRRSMACLMICFTLSFTVAGDYLAIQEYQVYASGLEIGMLEILIEAILSSMGISLSSQADLSSVAQGLSSVMKQYTDYEVGGVKIFPLISTVIADGMSDSGSWGLPAVCDQWLRNYLYNVCVSNMSSACNVASPVVTESNVESVRMEFSEEMWDEVFYHHPVAYYGSEISYNSSYMNSFSGYDFPMFVTILQPDGTFLIRAFTADNSYSCIVLDHRSSTSFTNSFNYWGPALQSAYVQYNSTKSGICSFYSADFSYNFESEMFNLSTFDCYKDYSWHFICPVSSSYALPAYFDPDIESDYSSCDIRIYFNKDTVIYNSLDDYKICSFSALYRPASRVYGLTSTAKPFEKDEATDTVIVPFDSAGVTARVEQAVSTAIAANPSITEEELNAAASDVIAAQNGTTDAVNQNTATLSSLLTSILALVRTISDNVARIANKSITDGSSALDLSNVQEQFEVIEGGASSGDPDDSGGDEDNTPSIWVPPGFVTVSFLAPLLEYFGEPLSAITKFQNAILENLQGAKEWILEIPAMITDVLSPLIQDVSACIEELPIREIYECILSLPSEIASALSDGLSIEVPSIDISDFPEQINYTSPLNRIVELLEQFFVIDTAAIGDALGGFETLWKDKLPFASKLFDLFKEFYFSPNYNYPVIKIRTPDILSTFYSDEYIILCDFSNFQKECLWARNIIKAWLYFCFGLSIFNHLKTTFHIG